MARLSVTNARNSVGEGHLCAYFISPSLTWMYCRRLMRGWHEWHQSTPLRPMINQLQDGQDDAIRPRASPEFREAALADRNWYGLPER